MRLWLLLCAGLLIMAAFDLAFVLARRDGVGLFEYAVGAIVVALLGVAAVRLGRRSA